MVTFICIIIWMVGELCIAVMCGFSLEKEKRPTCFMEKILYWYIVTLSTYLFSFIYAQRTL